VPEFAFLCAISTGWDRLSGSGRGRLSVAIANHDATDGAMPRRTD